MIEQTQMRYHIIHGCKGCQASWWDINKGYVIGYIFGAISGAISFALLWFYFLK